MSAEDGRPWQRVDLSRPEFGQPSEPPCTHVLYRGKRHAFSGPPEAAKTLFALALALEHRRLGHGDFAIVDFEQGEHPVRLMLEELGATADEIAALHYYVASGPPDPDTLREMAAAGVTLTIIDALAGAYGVSGLDDYKRGDAERFSQLWIQPLWQLEIATLALDHVVKNSEQRGRFSIGSERKLGAIDVHIGLEAVTHLTRGGRGLIRLSTHKDRPAHLPRPHPAELHLSSDPDTHRITWELRPVEADRASDLPPAAAKLLEALAAIGSKDAGASTAALVDWIAENHGHGLRRETVSKMLKLLGERGYAERLNPESPPGELGVWRSVTAVTDHVTSRPDDSSRDHRDRASVRSRGNVTHARHAADDGHTLSVDAELDRLDEPPPLSDDEVDATAAELEEFAA